MRNVYHGSGSAMVNETAKTAAMNRLRVLCVTAEREHSSVATPIVHHQQPFAMALTIVAMEPMNKTVIFRAQSQISSVARVAVVFYPVGVVTVNRTARMVPTKTQPYVVSFKN